MSAGAVLDAARAKGVMLAAAESCTGGMIMAALTAVPGSSDVVDRGFVTYSNAAKRDMLGVSPDTLTAHGAVSEAVAAEMAQGALARSDAGIAVAVTGIAGPGGSEHKPEGRVCFGLADAQGRGHANGRVRRDWPRRSARGDGRSCAGNGFGAA